MPPVPQGAVGEPSHNVPGNPNRSTKTGQNGQSGNSRTHVSAEPSPAIISSSSNVTAHILARRFLGPMPENVINSADVEEKRRLIRDMKDKAVGKILGDANGEHARGGFGTVDGRKGVRKVVHRIRVRRRDRHGEEIEEDVEIDDEDEDETGPHGKGKGKRKDVWVGESFDIGREFLLPDNRHESRTHLDINGVSTENPGDEDHSLRSVRTNSPSVRTSGSRPGASRKTTQETFVTARTELSTSASAHDSSSMIVNLDPERDPPAPVTDAPMPSGASSFSAPARKNRGSQGSSVQPLISRDGHLPGETDEDEEGEEGRDVVTPVKKAPGLRNRFRSAVKQSPGGSTELNSIASPSVDRRKAKTEPRGRSKSVQFHADPVTQGGGGREPLRRGNKQPAKPSDVLEREGDAVAGTSAGAAEHTAEELEEEEEGAVKVGQVIMRDRMLVRVGYHEKDGIGLFNEYTQRRDPCKRLDMFEEYIVVWRKGRVELYQDWSTPLKERVVGHKQLCFSIPLQPSRSSLSIFNPTDMTLALTTSASRLEADVDHIMRSRTTIHGAFKQRVKQSKQYQWLKSGKRGSHVFILKLSERTRALDWFWELWRDLGGELPTRLDVQIPALSTSVRLAIPDDDEEVGGKKTLELLNPRTVVDTCWEMLEGVYDQSKLEKDTDVGLAWKSEDGRLDWIAFDTTVQGRRRDWAILAGLARQNINTPVELQARKARHQPIWARLEDGTVLQEPQGIEGFLVRQKTATTPKDTVYVSTQDGNVFTSHVNHAHPPLQPSRAYSTPRDIFYELHDSHLDSEKHRMRLFLQEAAGCVDFRDIDSIDLVSKAESTAGDAQRVNGTSTSHRDDKTFEVCLVTGEKARFEAHSPEIAKEWVERLNRLVEYWKRRQRIDARQRMEVAKVQASGSTFTGNDLTGGSGDELLGEVWDWCPLRGCRPITYAGRIYVKKSAYDKYRLRYVVLSGGALVTFKIKKKQAFHERKKVFSLFGSYCYSGQMAHDELHEAADQDAFASHPRVYHDGLQSADGIADTTFIIRVPSLKQTWAGKSQYSWQDNAAIPPLSKKAPGLLFFRARSSLERDRWVWAINAEKERMVREHKEVEERLREHGHVPED